MDGLGCEVCTGAQLLGGLEDYFQDICGLLIRAGRVNAGAFRKSTLLGMNGYDIDTVGVDK